MDSKNTEKQEIILTVAQVVQLNSCYLLYSIRELISFHFVLFGRGASAQRAKTRPH
jgi:hypothetical protein